MLVLSRKSQERIQIGDRITISILKVKGSVVRIGVEAPADVHIRRSELAPLETAQEVPAEPTTAGSGRCSLRGTGAQQERRPERSPTLRCRLQRRMLKREVIFQRVEIETRSDEDAATSDSDESLNPRTCPS